MTFRKSFDTLAQSSAEWNHRHSTCRRKRSSQARFQRQPCALHMLSKVSLLSKVSFREHLCHHKSILRLQQIDMWFMREECVRRTPHCAHCGTAGTSHSAPRKRRPPTAPPSSCLQAHIGTISLSALDGCNTSLCTGCRMQENANVATCARSGISHWLFLFRIVNWYTGAELRFCRNSEPSTSLRACR